MKNESLNDARPELPPWSVILTILTLTLISAWLVFIRGWEPREAFPVVGFTALGIAFALLAALMIWTPPEDRSELWQQAWQAFLNDLDLLLSDKEIAMAIEHIIYIGIAVAVVLGLAGKYQIYKRRLDNKRCGRNG